MDANSERLAIAIDWLCEEALGIGSNDQPRKLTKSEQVEAEATVARISAAIDPRKLPPDIEWFWTTWKPGSFSMLTGHPRLTDPEFALDSWQDDPEWPRALFWIAYESHCFLGVELDFAGSPGPRIYDDCYASGEGLRLRAPDLACLISAAAAAIGRGDYEDYGDSHFAPTEAMFDQCVEAIDVARIPAAERGPFDFYDVLGWPKRWQLQQGVDDAGLALRGASCTIAELNEARRLGPVEATIVGRQSTGGGSGAGRLVHVEDHTGRAEIWIPVAVPLAGSSTTDTFEFDIVAEQLKPDELSLDDFRGDHHDATARALSGDLEGAAEAGSRIGKFLSGQHPIVATAVRPT